MNYIQTHFNTDKTVLQIDIWDDCDPQIIQWKTSHSGTLKKT